MEKYNRIQYIFYRKDHIVGAKSAYNVFLLYRVPM